MVEGKQMRTQKRSEGNEFFLWRASIKKIVYSSFYSFIDQIFVGLRRILTLEWRDLDIIDWNELNSSFQVWSLYVVRFICTSSFPRNINKLIKISKIFYTRNIYKIVRTYDIKSAPLFYKAENLWPSLNLSRPQCPLWSISTWSGLFTRE